jgi:hypothetical protein
LQVRRDGGPSALFVNVRIPRSWIEAAQFPIHIDPTVDAQVGASTDDAAQVFSDGSVRLAETRIATAAEHYFGLRWTSVGVPNGATIDVAYIELFMSDTIVDYSMDMQAADNPGTFTADTNNISGRSVTGNAVSWSQSGLTANVFNTSPSIVTPVQAVVNRSGWSSGNAMALIANKTSGNNERSWTYDSNTARGAKLHIEYTEGAADTLTQSAFRVYDDDAAEGLATPLAAENADLTITLSENFRTRLQVDSSGDIASGSYRIAYRYREDSEAAWGDWTEVPVGGS